MTVLPNICQNFLLASETSALHLWFIFIITVKWCYKWKFDLPWQKCAKQFLTDLQQVTACHF